MATPKENLLSLGQLTGTEMNTFTKQRDHCVKHSVNRPMLLQADLSSFQSHQHFKVTQLQQRWQELKERELRAQQDNRELLQQFEKAQDTLKEMLARTAAMKTIRMEYERYLEESSPRWQQQLKEKTQVAQRMRMEDYLSRLKNTEEAEVTKSYAERRIHSQGSIKKPQEVAATQDKSSQNIHSDYNQDGSSYHPYVQSSWLTHPQSQTARFPMRGSHRPQSSSYVRSSFLPHPHPFMLHHPTSTSSHHPWPRQNAPGWSSLQTDCPWSWTAGAAGLPSGSEALWDQLYTEEPPPESRVSQVVGQGVETSTAPSSKSERCGGSRTSCLSQELDIKPVRLSSGHAESSESGRDSSQVIRERRKKKEKRGRSQCTSSEKESHSSQESSRTSSAIIITSVAVVQSSESDASQCSTSGSKKRWQRSVGRVAESLRTEKVATEKTRSKGDDSGSQKKASQCASKESGNQTEESASENAANSSAVDKSETCREESGGIKNRAGDEKQKQESSSSVQSSAEEKDEEEEWHEKDLGGGDNNPEEKENSQKDDEQEEGGVEEEKNDDPEEKENSLREEEQEEEDEVFARKKATEEEETGAEDDMEEQECEVKDELKNEDCQKRSSASSQDEEVEEDESEREGDKTEKDEEGSAEEEDGESEEEEEQKSDKAREPEEESDSEDSIISPQENRRTHVIPEDAAEDDDIENKGNKTGFSDGDDSNDFSEEDDIENLLAPQEQRKKNKEKDQKSAEKSKATVSDNMKIFQVEDDRSTKKDHHSDSDEFDHFYD